MHNEDIVGPMQHDVNGIRRGTKGQAHDLLDESSDQRGGEEGRLEEEEGEAEEFRADGGDEDALIKLGVKLGIEIRVVPIRGKREEMRRTAKEASEEREEKAKQILRHTCKGEAEVGRQERMIKIKKLFMALDKIYVKEEENWRMRAGEDEKRRRR